MPNPQQPLLDDLQRKITEVETLRARSKHDDISDQPEPVIFRALTGLRAAISRLAGDGSTYVRQVEEVLKSKIYVGKQVMMIQGVAQGLLEDAKNGMLTSLQELIHADIFAGFLEMADHLLSNGYKDAAAVIAGSSLEEHLRLLAAKHGISTTDAGGRPKKADLINAELAGALAYSKLDQKNITAWLDLRNKAAHGHYSQYQSAQVGLFIASIRDFITRCTA
jgi:hypothetical protein